MGESWSCIAKIVIGWCGSLPPGGFLPACHLLFTSLNLSKATLVCHNETSSLPPSDRRDWEAIACYI